MNETTGPTARLGHFAAALTFEDIPRDVVVQAKLCVLDTLGCGLFGSTLPWVKIVRDTIAAIDDGRDLGVWQDRVRAECRAGQRNRHSRVRTR